MLRAIVALVAGLASAQAQAACTAHADCLDTQYCSNYTLYSQVSVLSCYECVDSWGMSCTSYGDSVDGSCERCAGAEAQNAASSGYNYTNCASSDECGDSMYCYRTEFDGYAMQDCWPCSDDTGKTCEEYGDAVEGSCSSCTGALPATNICSSHLECPNDSYCSSYENSMGTGIIVACNPCLDTWGYTCEDYDDAIDGSCQICAGASGEGSSSAIAGAPPSSSPPTLDNQCQGPLAPGTQIAFQSCSASTDCRKGEYCSAYWAFPGCVIDCWPCEDMYSLTCADYGDAIDRSCDTCSAAGGKAIVPAGCERHADCAYGQYCALVGGFKQCAACRAAGNSSNSTCQVRRECSCPAAWQAAVRASVCARLAAPLVSPPEPLYGASTRTPRLRCFALAPHCPLLSLPRSA